MRSSFVGSKKMERICYLALVVLFMCGPMLAQATTPRSRSLRSPPKPLQTSLQSRYERLPLEVGCLARSAGGLFQKIILKENWIERGPPC